MKSWTLLVYSLSLQIISTPTAWAECKTSQNPNLASLHEDLASCDRDAKKGGFTFLPQMISHDLNICDAYRPYTPAAEYAGCLTRIVHASSEILTCQQSEIRQQQMAKYDESLFQGFVKQYGTAEIPSQVLFRFNRLVSVAKSLFPETNGMAIQFEAYNANYLNAHAGASYKVLASAGLWSSDSPLSLDEVTAILAHEVGHVVRSHSLKLGCLALEWTSVDYDMSMAMKTFREDLDTGLLRGQIWSQQSVSVEYEADQLAAYLLKHLGLPPRLIAESLEKLKPKTQGFSSGSHPEFDVRIQTVRNYADQLDTKP